MIILDGNTKLYRSQIFDKKDSNVTQDDSNNQASILSSHRPWVRLGSLLALIGYISQMACQLLIISGLSLVPLSSLKAMEKEDSAQYFYSNPAYYYTDEDIETCINAIIAHDPELERVPNSTYLLKPTEEDHLTFDDQTGKSYYTAILPACSCVTGIHSMDIGVPALPAIYFLDKANQSNEFDDLLNKLLHCDNITDMRACIEEREKETGGNYVNFKTIIGNGKEVKQRKGIEEIKSELRRKFSYYQRLKKDVFDELFLQTLDKEEAYYKIVFPFCQNNSHWYVGELQGERNGFNEYSFTIMAHDPYGGGDFSRIFPEDAAEIRECLAQRLGLPTLALNTYSSPYKARQSDGISCGPIIIDDLFKVILGQPLSVPLPYEYGALSLRKKQINIVKAVQNSSSLTQAEARKFLKKNEQWVRELEELPQDRANRGISPSRQTDSLSLKPHQIKSDRMLSPVASARVSVSNEAALSSVTDSSEKSSTDLTRFYKDSDNILTHEFWKDKDLSDRLKRIKTDIEELKKKILNHKINSIEIKEFLEKYKKLLKCSEGEADFALIGCDIHFMSESDGPKDLGPQHTPAIIQLEDHTYDLLVNTASGGIKRIPAPEGMGLNNFDTFFQKYHPQSKQFLAWNDPLMQYLTSTGGHHPLIPIPHGQAANFSIRNIKGGSGCDLAILSRDGTNFMAIKNFNDIEEGVNELLYSLVALYINPSPQKLKMARVYDAILYPENCLNLIMEGANTHVIHYYLSTDLAESVVKACADYFAQFHLKNYNNKNINRGRYIKHVARAAKTLKGNPLKVENQEKPALHLLKGKQWTENNLKDLQSSNIIRLLSEQEQENFAHLVKRICDKFENNCNKVFRSLKAEDREEREYFLTLTHGDAHGNNFFYNNDEKINGYEISKDSFKRVTMIDVGKVARTYGEIGDPAEDVGRFIGSLWDWYFLQNCTESKDPKYYERIGFLQNQFVETYLKNIVCSLIFTEEKQKRFEEIFKENCNFYKLRFYRAIFNFTKNKDEKKDKEIKRRVLKSWMKEKANVELLSQNRSQTIVLKKEFKDRLWIPVAGNVIRWLPDRPIGFIEGSADGSDKSYLTLVWEDLHHTGTATLSSQAAIAGMGGIGKTFLALEYAHEALENNAYNLVYWLLSETETSLMKGYRDLLLDMGASLNDEGNEHIVELIKESIPRQGKCLLIYDNVPTADFLKDKIPTDAHILITSRYRHGWGKQPINLDVFRPEDSVKYLLHTIGLDETNLDNQKKAGELAHELAHFPLALSHAAHYIKLRSGDSVSGDALEKYLHEFKQESTAHFKEHQNPFKEDELEMTYENLIGKTLRMARKYISDLAQELMVHCSYLDPSSIVEDIFLGGWGSDEKKFQEALSQLSSLSLIKRSQNEPSFSIHRLVQLLLQQEQESDQKRAQLPNHINRLLASLTQYWIKMEEAIMRENLFLPDQLYPANFTLNSHSTRFYEHLHRFWKSRKIGETQIIDFKIGALGLHYLFQALHSSLRDRILKIMNQSGFYKQGAISSEILLQQELKEANLELSEKELESIIPLLPSDSEDRAVVIAVFREKVDPNQRYTVAASAKELMTDDMDGITRAWIIVALSKVDPAQRQAVAKSAKEFMNDDMHKFDRRLIIEYLEGIDSIQLPAFTKIAKELMTDNMNGQHRVRTIKVLRNIEPDQRQTVVTTTKELIIDNMDGEVRVRIIEALSKVDPAQHQAVVRSVKELIIDNMDGEARMSIIEALSKVDPGQRQAVVASTKELLAEDINGLDRGWIIQTFSKVGPVQRQAVVASTKELMAEDMDRHERAAVIIALSRVDPAQHQAFIANVKELTTEDMDGPARAEIIVALSKVDPAQRQAVVASIKKLLTEDMDGLARAEIIVALSRVDPAQHQAFIANVKELTTEDTNGLDRGWIIQTFSKIDSAQRQAFVANAKELMTEYMDEHERVTFIETFMKLSPAPRQAFIMNAGELIDVLTKIDPKQRQAIVRCAKELMTEDMRGYMWCIYIKFFIVALAIVAPDQRQAFIANAKELMTEDMDGYERVKFIEILIKLPPPQRQAIVRCAKELMTEDMDGHERGELIDVLTKIDPSQYQTVIAKTRFLLELVQKKNDEAITPQYKCLKTIITPIIKRTKRHELIQICLYCISRETPSCVFLFSKPRPIKLWD